MYDLRELQRVLDLQRDSYLKKGDPSLQLRLSRSSRMALALLENIDMLADALCADYGWRSPALSKSFEGISWVEDVQQSLANVAQWMQPRMVNGGFVQAKPKGVVGVIGTWSFPLASSFQPAMAALAAGNRVMLNFPEQLPNTGALLRKLLNERFDESEVALFTGDIATATSFATLQFDHLLFTGSPEIGTLVSQAAARNLVPVTLALGGKNPAVIARDADLAMAATRIASTRLINGGQACLCPDYAFIPDENFEDFIAQLRARMRDISGDYPRNPAIVPVINEHNHDRVLALVDDAVARGTQRIEILPGTELQGLPDRAARRIAPILLIEPPEDARINMHEIFGPVLVLKRYGKLQQVIDYIARRPAPLAAYWYGDDGVDFQHFLAHTTSGGVTRNDGFMHGMLPGAPFGGVGMSGSGACHGRAGFDTFTHYRTIAHAHAEHGVADAVFNGTQLKPGALADGNHAIETAIASFKKHAGPLRTQGAPRAVRLADHVSSATR